MAGNLARLGVCRLRSLRGSGLFARASSRLLSTNQGISSDPVIVRVQKGSLYISMFFKYNGKTRMMNRVRTDSFEGTLQRISLVSAVATGNSGGSGLPVALYNSKGEEKRPGTLNIHAFCDGDILKIGDSENVIAVNPPCVLGVSLGSYLTVGTRLYPKVLKEYVNDDMLRFEWRRIVELGKGETREDVICTEREYTPTRDDIGFRLSISVSPIMPDGIPPAAPVTVSPLVFVEEDNREPGFVARAAHTSERYAIDSDKLRVVSYNILGEMYALDELGKNDNYPYCELKGVQTGYRDMLLGQELPAYNADIICLQEVEERRFHVPVLTCLPGYEGKTTMKKNLREGVGILWRKDRFTLLESKSYRLKDALFEDPCCAEFFQNLPFRIRNGFKSRNTVLQLAHLQQKSDGRDIIVGNTHLYYHPAASDQRLVMGFIIMQLMSAYKKSIAEWTQCPQAPALLLCGDFNGNEERAVHDIVTKGSLARGHPNRISTDNRDVIEHTCEHDLKFGSVAPHPTVPWSNYTSSFVSLLDFVYFEESELELHKVVPMPSEEVVKEFTALPSVRFCSDHLPVIGDVKFKNMV